MNKKIIFIVIAAVLFLLLYRACSHSTKPQKPEGLTTVTVSPVIQKDVVNKFKTIGTVQPYASVEIKSMVTGPLLSVNIKEGDVVQKNQVLFTIDQRPFVAALEQAQAALSRDHATQANYQLQIKRSEPLVKKGYINKQDYDTLKANEKSATAIVEADQAAIRNAKLNLDYTTIRAPMDGVTGAIPLKTGSLIKANDTVAMVTINQITPIYVVFAIPQNKLSIVRENLRRGAVTVQVVIDQDNQEEGILTFIDNTVNPATGTIELKGTFKNQDRKLWPGQYVTAIIPLEHLTNALMIPSLAIMAAQKGFYVFTVDKDNAAHLRYVTPGPIDNNETVILSGLTPGEKVVIAGQLRLREGSKVELTNP